MALITLAAMIRSFRHKGLSRFYQHDEVKGLPTAHLARIGRILDALEAAETVGELDLPGFRLHPLKGGRKGVWAVAVSGNWRITFAFAAGQADEIDLEDYH